MNLGPVYKDITSLFTPLLNKTEGEEELPVWPKLKVYREEYAIGKVDPDSGYVTWDLTTDPPQKCSEGFTGAMEGILDVTVYAKGRAAREKLQIEILDIFCPKNEATGRRIPLQQIDLEGCFLSYVSLYDTAELVQEKTGQSAPEVPGTHNAFTVKFTLKDQ